MANASPHSSGRLLALAGRTFFAAALIYVFASLLFYGLDVNAHRGFFFLGRLRMLPPFADLRWVTSLSECGSNLTDLAEGRLIGCDPYGRYGIGYPPLSIELARLLGVQGRHTGLIGFSTGLTLVALLLAQLRRIVHVPWIRDLFSALLLFGFPVQLALERANIDVIIFLLLTLLVAVVISSRLWTIPLAFGLSWIAVGLKVYPALGIFFWSLQTLAWRRRFDAFQGAVLTGVALGVATVLPWFFSDGKAAAPGAGFISHAFLVPNGLSFLPPSIGLTGGAQPLISLAILLLALFLCWQSGASSRWHECLEESCKGYEKRFMQSWPALLSCTWLSCYFFSSSFDYRLIFALPGFVSCLALWSSKRLAHTPGQSVLAIMIAISPLPFLVPLAGLYPATSVSMIRFFLVPLDQLCDMLFLPLLAACVISLLIPSASLSRSLQPGLHAPSPSDLGADS